VKTRIISALLGIPLAIFLIFYGSWPLVLTVLFCCLIGQKEFFYAFKSIAKPLSIIGYGATIIYIFFVLPRETYLLLFLTALILILLVSLVFLYPKRSMIDLGITFFGFFYVTFLFSHILLLRNMSDGIFLVWLIFISAWGSDTGAYFIGVGFGKHKLCPNLSPNKTIEGAIGGLLGGSLLCYLYGWIVQPYMTTVGEGISFPLLCLILGLCGAALSQLGDLSASATKRFTKIKDYGDLIPGHGGILDRFDSILFTAPFVYYAIKYFG